MEELGWETLLAVDHDAKACQVYRANIPAREVRCGDLVPMLGTLPAADVIVGGPPCQPFSHAGKREGAEDARDCVPDFIAAVAKGRPRMFLMEQVQGFTTIEDGRYMHRAVRAMEAAGYVVQMRLLDAVSYGVPQFRLRAWFWGIRRDLHASGAVRHRWPTPTHVWPWPDQACMFGGDLRPAVTTGQALGLDIGVGRAHRIAMAERGAGNANRWHGPHEPAQSIEAAGCDGATDFALRRARGASVERRDHPAAEPAAEPAPTLADGSGAEGLVRIEGASGWSGQRILEPGQPGPTVGGGTNAELIRTIVIPAKHEHLEWNGEEYVRSKQKRSTRSTRSTRSPAGTLGGDSRHALTVRRLTPAECARLQSLPDDFVWPDSVAKTHRYRIIGNGWASLMALHMSRALRAADPDSRTLIDLFCGGGCGAVGWHGRAWEYEPAAGLVTTGLEPAPCR